VATTSAEERIRELEAKLARADAALAKAAHERDEYRKLYELVTLELERVKRYLRAQNKSERVDAAQVQLAFAQVADLMLPADLAEKIADDENRGADERKKKSGAHGRAKLPTHLPLERVVLRPSEEERRCTCCGAEMHEIGEETSERLDYRPASLIRVQTARIKYACKCECGGVVIADVPDAVIDRGLALPGLLAHVVVSKYADHLPLNRLEQMFARDGVALSRSTLSDWIAHVADLLSPISAAMGRAAISAHRIHTDDTGIAIQASGKTQKGHVWVYVADDEHVVFRFTPRRKSDGPREFLKGFTGYVQADAANLYDKLFGDGGAHGTAIEVGCWAHYRESVVICEQVVAAA